MSEIKELSEREEAFVVEYVSNGFIGARAYKAVFPNCNPTYAASAAHRMRSKPHVKEAIIKRMEGVLGSKKELANKALYRLHEIAFAQKGDPDYQTAHQLKAIELVQKQLGLQMQNIKAEIDGKTEIEINILGEEKEKREEEESREESREEESREEESDSNEDRA